MYTGLVFIKPMPILGLWRGNYGTPVYASATQAQTSVIQKSSSICVRQIFPRKDDNHTKREISLLVKVLEEPSHLPAGYLSGLPSS